MTLLQKIYNFFKKQKQEEMTTNHALDAIRSGINQATIPAVLTSYSQPHVLQQRMKEANLTHGDRVKADISPVRLESNFGKMVMYFCPAQTISVHKKLEAGDGGSIPCEAIIEGFQLPANIKSGLYDLKNVELFSNGTMQVIAGPNTVFEAI